MEITNNVALKKALKEALIGESEEDEKIKLKGIDSQPHNVEAI